MPFLFEKVKVVIVTMAMLNERASYFFLFLSSYVWEFRSQNKKYTFVDLADIYTEALISKLEQLYYNLFQLVTKWPKDSVSVLYKKKCTCV